MSNISAYVAGELGGSWPLQFFAVQKNCGTKAKFFENTYMEAFS